MPFELIRNPGSSLARARKSKSMGKSVNILLTSSFLLSVALVFAVFRLSAPSVTPLMIISLGAVSFFMTILMAMVFGWTTQIIAVTVGGRGRYYEGFTAVVYSIFVPSLGLLVASLMTAAPGTWPISMSILFPSFALGVATFYRGVKELFRLDTPSSMATVAATVISFLLTAYALITLNLLGAGVV
ncbi:MAG: YIP1 family protein [Candidatus Aenigmarchaeota archaeon]|nr:YIP1 family protein [Candidatus Aenigmarchaeota archaeon]